MIILVRGTCIKARLIADVKKADTAFMQAGTPRSWKRWKTGTWVKSEP